MKLGSEFRWPTFQEISKYFQQVMAGVYILMGIVIFWRSEQLNIPVSYSVPLGIILIAYGVIRGYRAFHRKRQE